MKQENINYANFENLNSSERVARIVVSIAAIVFAMGSSIAGTALFAVVSVLGIALSLTGIIGWDPVRALSVNFEKKTSLLPHNLDLNR